MTGLRLNGGHDFSRSCAVQQSHTTAGTALQNALMQHASFGAYPSKPKSEVSTAKEDRLWLPAQAAFHTSAGATGPLLDRRPDEVQTQRLAPPPPPPREAPPREPRENAAPRRPQTAHPRLQEDRAQTDPGIAPAAGMRTPRAVRAWQSADAAFVAKINRRPVGGGAEVAMAEDPGWSPHRQMAPEELRYNPITHQVDVFVNVDGDIHKCEPSAEEYRQILVRLENAPPKKGRRKGLAEFVDLCCAGRARPNPHIKAAYANNRRVFEKQRGPCTNMYEIAQGYPGRPRVFEPDARISNPGGQIPRPWTPAPTPVVPPSPGPRGGNRVRRPQTARAPARPPETLHAPASRLAERADDGG